MNQANSMIQQIFEIRPLDTFLVPAKLIETEW